MSSVVTDAPTSGATTIQYRRKLNFEDVTIDHDCILPAPPNPIEVRFSSGRSLVTRLLSLIVVSRTHPSTRNHFQSSDAVHKEIARHTFSNYWFIIHPFSKLKFVWNTLMAFTFYFLFLHTPFAYAFHQDTLMSKEKWCISIGAILNTLCIFDILVNFFTGFEMKYGNFIVLHQPTIIQNYLRGLFIFDVLSSLPFIEIYRIYFSVDVCETNSFTFNHFVFHFVYLMKFLRFTSWPRMEQTFNDLMKKIKLGYVKSTIIKLMFKTILIMQLFICFFKATSAGTFFYSKADVSRSKDASAILNPSMSYISKYLKIFDLTVWVLFDTAFNNDYDVLVPGKILVAFCMVIGVTFNIYLLIHILNIMNTIHAPRTKFNEIMNQLDAYMTKKHFPIHLQRRLKFFYRKKFRNFYYREDEIMGTLSEPLCREIIINTGQLFAERVQLFKNIPKSLVSKIAGSLKKEQFLANDLIVKAGSIGDCMFFIASGTVCVTTTNGKELCHLEDGDHFGEIALILKNNKRIATVMAIEYCEIYILDYASFKKYVQINETIMQKLTVQANVRMQSTLLAEEDFKKELTARIARESFDET